jgi:hypothetical protein
VDPTSFIENIRDRIGASEKDGPKIVRDTRKQWNRPKPAQRVDVEVDGSLAVRASLRDLERVELLIARAHTALPQLNIKVKLLELTPEAARRLRRWTAEAHSLRF